MPEPQSYKTLKVIHHNQDSHPISNISAMFKNKLQNIIFIVIRFPVFWDKLTRPKVEESYPMMAWSSSVSELLDNSICKKKNTKTWLLKFYITKHHITITLITYYMYYLLPWSYKCIYSNTKCFLVW